MSKNTFIVTITDNDPPITNVQEVENVCKGIAALIAGQGKGTVKVELVDLWPTHENNNS